MKFLLKFMLPHQEDFFKSFRALSEKLLAVSQEYDNLLKNLETLKKPMDAIEIHVYEAQQITNNTLEQLHKTFITPFDRYDIHRFVKKMDDAVDSVHRSVQRVMIYQLTMVPQEVLDLAVINLKSAEVILSATKQLHSLKNATNILELCDVVNHLENEADQLLVAGVSRLFQTESDLRQLLKVKEIYEYTKASINGCQIVANIIKDIVLEYS